MHFSVILTERDLKHSDYQFYLFIILFVYLIKTVRDMEQYENEEIFNTSSL